MVATIAVHRVIVTSNREATMSKIKEFTNPESTPCQLENGRNTVSITRVEAIFGNELTDLFPQFEIETSEFTADFYWSTADSAEVWISSHKIRPDSVDGLTFSTECLLKNTSASPQRWACGFPSSSSISLDQGPISNPEILEQSEYSCPELTMEESDESRSAMSDDLVSIGSSGFLEVLKSKPGFDLARRRRIGSYKANSNPGKYWTWQPKLEKWTHRDTETGQIVIRPNSLT
jgi:hypothetical protein